MDTSLEHKAFLLLLGLVTVAFCWLLIPFYGAVFWAVILAIIFQPLQIVFERRFGMGSNLAARLTMLVCIVIAIIPMAVILGALVNEAARLVQRIQSGAFDTSTLVRDAQAMLPDWAQRLLERFGVGEDLEAMRDRFIDALQQIGQLLATRALNLGQNTLRFIASTGIMLYVLFFLFRDGRVHRPQHPRLDAADPGVQPGAARPLRRGGARDGQGQHRHRGDPGHHRRRRLLGARHPGRPALGRADGAAVAAAGGRRGDRLGAGGRLPLRDRLDRQGA